MSSSNNTSVDTSESYSDKDLYGITFFSIVIPLTLCGNLLVCIAFCTDRYLKSVPSNYLIVSLAVADIVVACVDMGVQLATHLMKGVWIFGTEFCIIYHCLTMMLVPVSILNLCAISIDRYLRIKYALHYDLMMTPVKMGIIIMAVWVLAALMSIAPIFLEWVEIYGPYNCRMDLTSSFFIGYSCSAFFIPCIVIVVIHLMIFRIAYSHARDIRSQTISNQPQKKFSIYETKAALTLGITTAFFVISWLPYFICLILVGRSVKVPRWILNVVISLSWSNSCINPIIYSIFNTQYRQAFKRILSCKNSETSSVFSGSSTNYRERQVIKDKNSCPPKPALEIQELLDNGGGSPHTMKNKSDNISICSKKGYDYEARCLKSPLYTHGRVTPSSSPENTSS